MQILRILLNKLTVVEYFNRSWEKDFEKEFAPGSSVTVKFPWRPTTSDGMEYQPQAISRLSTTVSEGERSVLDFFSDRGNAIRRARLMEMLEPVFTSHRQDVEARRQSIEKTAALDIGINDWQKYGLQEQLNSGQQVNDPTKPKPQTPPFNLKQRKQRTSPATMGALLVRDHDKNLNYMKPTEQLLGESRI